MEFKEFEQILINTIEEFKEKEKIGFIGLFGSLNVETDLDFLIAQNKNVNKGEFLKAMCNFLELLEENIKKQKSRLIAFSFSILQEESRYLGKVNAGKDIFLHLNSFPDLNPRIPK